VDVEVAVGKGVGVNTITPPTTEQYSEPDIRDSVAICKRSSEIFIGSVKSASLTKIKTAHFIIQIESDLLAAWSASGDGAQLRSVADMAKGAVTHDVATLHPRASDVKAT
jgi:hypothetical protein